MWEKELVSGWVYTFVREGWKGDTYVVKVDIDTAEVHQREVPDGIGALDDVWVAIPRRLEPGVFFRDELVGIVVRPELGIISA